MNYRTLLLSFSLFFFTTPLFASIEQRQALAELAQDVKKFLDGKGATDVAIGKFDGPPANKTGAGPGFAQILIEELQKIGVVIKEQAKLGIEGRFSLTEVPATDEGDAKIGKVILALKVKLEIVDAFDNRNEVNFERKVLKDSTQTVKGPHAVVKAFGVTTPLDPKAGELDNDKRMREEITKDPSFCKDGTLIRSKEGQPYAIELLVAGKPREVTDKGGLATVDIKRDEIYAVRIVNETDFEAAVQLTIDGLSMFAFSELRHKDGPKKGEPLYTAMIVPPKKGGKPGEILIEGWHKNNDKGGLSSFLVTEYPRSVAGSLKRTEGVGTITATFQASWEGSIDNAPPDEPGKRRGGLGDATGFGPPTGGGLKEVKRSLGVIRDCITVRYTTPK